MSDFCAGYTAPHGCNVDAGTDDCECARHNGSFADGMGVEQARIVALIKKRLGYLSTLVIDDPIIWNRRAGGREALTHLLAAIQEGNA